MSDKEPFPDAFFLVPPGQNNMRTDMAAAFPSLFEEEGILVLDEEQERQKRNIYNSMNPRRRKFVDRIGYDVWNPFQEPKEPLDIRKDRTNRTLQDLVRDFMRASNGASRDQAWKKGAMECAMGVILKDEKYQGIFDFCIWYHALLQKEGREE